MSVASSGALRTYPRARVSMMASTPPSESAFRRREMQICTWARAVFGGL